MVSEADDRAGASWRLYHVRDLLPAAGTVSGVLGEVAWMSWPERRDGLGIPVGTPYLVSPEFHYDVELNEFFYSTEMRPYRMSTLVAYARDLKGFLTFLHQNRGGVDWRHASEVDHLAYLGWRRDDAAGPRVAGSTWDRELTGTNRFFRWQVAKKRLGVSPIPQRPRKPNPGRLRPAAEEKTPATLSHDARRERIQWLPAKSYRQWRDVGIRGYRPDGLRDARFRGRWAARNSAFVDLMVRTGLRLTEQASLTTFEIPQPTGQRGYRRFWLPAAVAKGGSARWIYVPGAVLRDLADYAQIDRLEMIENARAKGLYERTSGQLIIGEPGRAVVSLPGQVGTIAVSKLRPEERRRLFVDGPDGLEPASFWLAETGMPMSVSTWKGLFSQANARCTKAGIDLHAHAHLLRHTFAVLTLEQLQRGHLAALAHLNPDQRSHYTRIFGDPLDWVRRRLGHTSVTTTQVYLHALQELEMETRMALVPDGLWEDPRDPGLETEGHE